MATPYSWIEDFPVQITAEEYEALPEEFCRTIEVIDGHILKCESPSRLHNRVARKMAVTFEENRKPEPCLMIDTDIDVRITDVPLNVRQPDVTVSRCIPDDQRLYSTDVILVVEVVSPDSSLKTDTVDKKAAYADAGIRFYLIVFLNASKDGIDQIEEYRLDPTGTYRLVQLHTRRLTMTEPIPVDIPFADLSAI
jgi:Uma2 family endonuclease